MPGRLVPLATQLRPSEWFIAFHPHSTLWLAELFSFGRFRHVSAFAFVPGVAVWVFYDPWRYGTQLTLEPDGEGADFAISRAIDGATVVKFISPVVVKPRPAPLIFLCTTAVARLTGVRSRALRPDRFLRDCLDDGAEIVSETDGTQQLGEHQRPGARSGAPQGA